MRKYYWGLCCTSSLVTNTSIIIQWYSLFQLSHIKRTKTVFFTAYVSNKRTISVWMSTIVWRTTWFDPVIVQAWYCIKLKGPRLRCVFVYEWKREIKRFVKVYGFERFNRPGNCIIRGMNKQLQLLRKNTNTEDPLEYCCSKIKLTGTTTIHPFGLYFKIRFQ